MVYLYRLQVSSSSQILPGSVSSGSGPTAVELCLCCLDTSQRVDSNSNLYPRYENLFPRHNYAWILVKGLIRVLIYILAPDEIDEAEDVAPLYDYLEENHDHANKDNVDKSANFV